MGLLAGILSLQLGERADSVPSFGNRKVNLARYDGGRFAVVLHHDGQRQVLRGVANYERDRLLGAVLRIRAADDSDEMSFPEFVLQEGFWDEKIVADEHFGCDFAIDLSISQGAESTRECVSNA